MSGLPTLKNRFIQMLGILCISALFLACNDQPIQTPVDPIDVTGDYVGTSFTCGPGGCNTVQANFRLFELGGGLFIQYDSILEQVQFNSRDRTLTLFDGRWTSETSGIYDFSGYFTVDYFRITFWTKNARDERLRSELSGRRD
ncbi:MAG: hypothetical protein ACI8ZN_000877 [Bacteroidia bacterium]|jgi:hypothetical protein